MNKTIAVSLHDYIAINKRWEQLWADDDVAYWFNKMNPEYTPDYAKGYKYCVFESVPYKDYPTTNRSFYCKDLKQAFEKWNELINQHLTVRE